MPDVQEVFRMATQKVRPEVSFVDRQLDRQRRRTRNRKAGVYVLVAALGVAGAVIAVRAIPERGRTPIAPPERPTDGVAIVDLEGAIVGTIGADGSEEAESLLQDFFAAGISLSPDGTRVAVSNGFEIHTMNADGTGLAELTDGVDPAWSPDGSLIAFTDARGIHVISPDGTGRRTIVKKGPVAQAIGSPAWSSDGERIAYSLVLRSGAGIYVVDADGGRPTRLTTYCCDMLPSWHPDGTTIVFTRSGQTTDLFTVPADGGARAVPLAATDAGEHMGLWSPSGSLLAYGATSGLSGLELDVLEWDVHVLDMRTGEDRVVLEGARPIAWSSEQTLLVEL